MSTLQNATAWTNLGLTYLLNEHTEVSHILSPTATEIVCQSHPVRHLICCWFKLL